MSLVVTAATMSLDGYVAGPGGSMDWVFDLQDPGAGASETNPLDQDIIETTGAVLSGRGCYDIGLDISHPDTSSGLYGGRWQGPEFILTHRPPDDDDERIFVSGNIVAAVHAALDAARGKNLLVLGSNVVAQCFEAGLIDQVRLHLVPRVLGAGTPMFAEGVNVNLEVTDVSRWGQVTNLDCRVLR